MAFTALIKSGFLRSDQAAWGSMADELIQLAGQGAMLQRECGAILHSALTADGVGEQQVSVLLEKLHHAKLLKTSEGLAIWLTAQQMYDTARLPAGVWHKNDPLCAKERSTVVTILKGNSDSTSDDAVTNGTPQSIPSFTWPIVLATLSKRKDKDFTQFWQEAIDDGHFTSTASTERKSLGLQITTLAIGTSKPELVSALFTKNLLRCIINHRSNKQSNLHQSAKVPLDALVNRAKKDVTVISDSVTALLGINGAVNFDSLTKTKTIDSLISAADDTGLAALLSTVATQIYRPTVTEHIDAEGSRRAMSDICTNVARAIITQRSVSDVEPNAEAALDNLECVSNLLARTGYLETDPKAASPPISETTQELFRTRTTSCLGSMLKSRTPDIRNLLCRLGSTLWAQAEKGEAKLLIKPDAKVKTLLSAAAKNLSALEKKQGKKQSKAKASRSALMLLYSMSFLQALGGDPDSLSMLEDLELCYQSYESSDDTTVILIEILLSFLSRGSAVLRTMAEQVFAAFAPDMTEDGLQSMLDILQKKESMSGQEELFEHADDQDAADDAESSSESDDSDVEIIDVEDDSASDSESTASSDGDVDKTAADDADGPDDDETKAFEAKLAQALGSSRSGGAANDMDHDAATSSESDMDDEQMMALETHLTTIFQERAKLSSKKQDNRDAKTNIVNFKNRVLDLLSLYVKSQSDNNLVLHLVTPLLDTVRTTSSRQTAEKAFAVLKTLAETCTRRKAFPDDEDLALATLKEVHAAMRHKAVKLHGTACSRASLFLAKTLVSADPAHFEAVSSLYADSLRAWYLDPKSRVPGSVFTEWTSWCVATRKTKA